jgi:hypothetical protein
MDPRDAVPDPLVLAFIAGMVVQWAMSRWYRRRKFQRYLERVERRMEIREGRR